MTVPFANARGRIGTGTKVVCLHYLYVARSEGSYLVGIRLGICDHGVHRIEGADSSKGDYA
jgi:hypothetical protein